MAGRATRAEVFYPAHAWGTPDEGSDLDLVVVVPDGNDPSIQRMRRAHRCLRFPVTALDRSCARTAPELLIS